VAFGSAGYAAPEQYGKTQTTTQSDIYSLGATLHHLLSGHDPSNSPFIFAPLDLAEPEGLKELITQMLATDPAQRPASMAAIKRDLERMADDLVTGHTRQQPPVLSALLPMEAVLKSLVLYRGHFDTTQALAWTSDGTLIASGGLDQTIHIWESDSGKKRYALPQAGVVSGLAWSPSGDELTWASGGISYWTTRAKSVYNISHLQYFTLSAGETKLAGALLVPRWHALCRCRFGNNH
jgi:serine/threonine protein kinase